MIGIIPDELKEKAKRMLPILWREYRLLDEDDPIAVKINNEIDYWEHIKNGRVCCIYTKNEQHNLCRYKKFCEVKN